MRRTTREMISEAHHPRGGSVSCMGRPGNEGVNVGVMDVATEWCAGQSPEGSPVCDGPPGK